MESDRVKDAMEELMNALSASAAEMSYRERNLALAIVEVLHCATLLGEPEPRPTAYRPQQEPPEIDSDDEFRDEYGPMDDQQF